MPDIIHKDFRVPLPADFSPLVVVGDIVTIDQPIAQKSSEKEQIINISQQLRVPLKKIKHVLKKNPGDPIRKGDIIAEKKSLLGFNNAAVISNIDGIVFRYERNTGNLVIRTSFDAPSEKVISPVAGTITLCDNETIVITSSIAKEDEDLPATQEVVIVSTEGSSPLDESDEAKSEGIGGIGEGDLFVFKASFSDGDEEKVLYDLTGEATGKIVLGEVLTREVLMKGIGIGVIGFIGAKISKEDLDFFAEKQPKTPIIQVDSDTLERLTYWEGSID